MIVVLGVGDEVFPAAPAKLGDAQQPFRIELRVLVILEEVLARHAKAFGQAQQLGLQADQPPVDVVKLLDQRVDAVLVERQRFDVGDDLFLERLVFALLRRRQRLVLELVLDILVLQAAQLLVGVGDAVEGFENLRLEFGFHRRQRNGILHIVFFLEGVFGDRRFASSPAGGLRGAVERRLRSRPRAASASAAPGAVMSIFGVLLAVGAGIGRFEIDDVAQQNLAVDQFVAPDDDGLEGQRAFAEPGDHRLAAGLDAFGDGDFALARQKLDRAHFAQIHAHRIVGAVGRLGGARRDGLGARRLDEVAALGLFFLGGSAASSSASSASSASTTLMPISLSIGVNVFDLVGGDFFRRQHGVQFGIGDKAALFGELDHPLDGGVGEIEQGAVGGLGHRRLRLPASLRLFSPC